MSWKLFWQIVLLIVVAVVILISLKYGLLYYKHGHKGGECCPYSSQQK